MRLSLRAKLTAIVGAAAFAFVVVIVSSALISRRVERQLGTIQEHLLPKLEMGPRLDAEFEHLRRALQDAVAANDADLLAKTRETKNAFLERLSAARDAIDPAQALQLARSVEEYYAAAIDVSRRLLAAETGEALVGAMADMQTKQSHVAQLLKIATAFDRKEIANAFTTAVRAQTTGGAVRLVISIICLALVILLSVRLSRGVLRSVDVLTTGLKRYARGEFGTPVAAVGNDEFGDVADQANQMAASLQRLATERDRTDWLKNGQAGLSQELRGELEPSEVAGRAIRFLARTLDARAGALYYADVDRTLQLLGQYALSPEGTDQTTPSFRPGEGLVGQAALQDDIMIVPDAPPDYLRVRSGLGEATPHVVALLPIIHAGSVNGVVELGLFSAWMERSTEFLLSIRETLAIALEVARARAAMRQLLAETQRQATRLSTQEEELRVNNEELQTQQKELRQTNEELAQQAEELDSQRRALEQRNADLDQARGDLERKAAELTTVSAYKSQFLTNMSHELRTPLNSMLLLSNLLATNDGGNLTDKQIEYANTIYSAGRDLLALINQVLDLARIEAGKHELHVATTALADLAHNLERVFLPLAHDKGLRLKVELANDLPPTISTDRQRAEQILNNLLANAIKFTERGDVTLRIARPAPEVVLRRQDLRPDSTVALSVSDTGLGIAPEDQERIFAPFEQVDSAPDRRYGGTGLGLNIARELANLLGGELQLRSVPGAGSTFVCYLPEVSRAEIKPGASPQPTASNGTVAAPPTPAAAPSNKPTNQERGGAQAHNLSSTLLIIEDDQRFAEVLGDIIEGQGLKYRIARDGRSGVRMARDTNLIPTAIILDVMLPDIDGWTVLEQLRAHPVSAGIPVHFLSAVDGADHGTDMGAVGYLRKPATRQELLHMVQSLVPDSARRRARILVVEADSTLPGSLATQLAGENLDLQLVTSGLQALERLSNESFACMILDLSLPDMDGLVFLRTVREKCGADTPSVVVYTGRALSKPEAQMLEAHSEAVVLKEGSSTERLLDEVRLFVRRLNEGQGPRRPAPARLHPADVRLKDRKILIADDDMRTVYALSAMLRAKGVDVLVADTGLVAITVLDEHPEIEAVLMDIMMPEMDGYEAMRRIRQDARFATLPIIALTAKAMKGDEEKCLEAGASAYLAKPIEPDRLVRMLHSILSGQITKAGRHGN
jgi:CheY-like chemotaxis protein/signal transduction histidine kinase